MSTATEPRYRFITNCVNSDGDSINEMKHAAIQIKGGTFRRYADPQSFREVTEGLGYDRSFPIGNDWHVAYYRSTYQGKPCVYFVWSAIEYVFA